MLYYQHLVGKDDADLQYKTIFLLFVVFILVN